MRLVAFMILVATALGVAFPAYLIKAIRSKDEQRAYEASAVACFLFGAVVFISLCIVNS